MYSELQGRVFESRDVNSSAIYPTSFLPPFVTYMQPYLLP